MTPDDATGLAALVRTCRDVAAPHAFPSPDDVASLLAHPNAPRSGAVWEVDGAVVAWAQTQADFENVLFEVAPAARGHGLAVAALEWGLERLRSTGASGADTPLESDDAWRSALLASQSFVASGDSVVHLRRGDMSLLPGQSCPTACACVRSMGTSTPTWRRIARPLRRLT